MKENPINKVYPFVSFCSPMYPKDPFCPLVYPNCTPTVPLEKINKRGNQLNKLAKIKHKAREGYKKLYPYIYPPLKPPLLRPYRKIFFGVAWLRERDGSKNTTTISEHIPIT